MEKLKSQTIEDGVVTYELNPTKKETTPGLFVSAGIISEDYDNVSWEELLQDYTNMRNGGAVESTTISILKYPILRAGYKITHDDEELVKYVQWVFNNLIDSFGEKNGYQEFINHLLLALDFGCSFFEKVYENGVETPDGTITNIISRLAPFKPETIWRFHYNDDMQFSGIRFIRRKYNKVMEYIDIPVEKLFFYSHNAEYGDPRGRSEFRPTRNLYRIKKDIIMATARAQQRGAGIPEIQSLKSGISTTEQGRLETVGKSIGNMKSGYIVTDADIKVTLHQLQIQGNPEQLLEFINREMFFNTLTEFMTSGIGQSGSRSATSEHKGSYELKCGVVTMAVEKKINMLIKEIVDISYFGPQEVYPEYKISSLQQTDIVSVSDSLSKLFQAKIIIKQTGDEDFIRGMFNMPPKDPNMPDVIDITPPTPPELNPDGTPKIENKTQEPVDETITDNTEEVPKDKATKTEDKLDKVPKKTASVKRFDSMSFQKRLNLAEQMDFIQKTFDVKGTNDFYMSCKDKARAIILEVKMKYVNYIAKKFVAKELIDMKYDKELSNRLNKLYKDSYSFGANQVKKEIELASKKKLASKVPVPEDQVVAVSQSITRFAGRLLYNVKTVVEDELDTKWDSEEQSVEEFISDAGFEDWFKTDELTLVNKTTDGYGDGRADTLEENADQIDLFFYNSILDNNLCDDCAELTGAVMTQEEADSQGLEIGESRVNPSCAGGDSCRCILQVYQLKGDFGL